MLSSGVSIRDLEFSYGYRTAHSRDGRISRRWVPVGVPRIRRGLEQCVFFLYGHHPQTGQVCGPGATGFFVARESRTLAGSYHVYAVSNCHAIGDYPCIRVNWGENEVRLFECDPTEWIWSETDDLAAVDVTDLIMSTDGRPAAGSGLSWISEYNFVTRDFSFHHDVGIGDQTVMLGLFTNHAGGSRNVPVGRFGNLAALPDDSTPVRLGPNDRLARPAYLNDMRSRSGFSGSPVWVLRTPYDDMNELEFTGSSKLFHSRSSFFRLLGVHRGQFREQTTVRLLEDGRALQSGDDIEIASSMTVVIPSSEIVALLNKSMFEQQRIERDGRSDRIKAAQAWGETSRSLE